MELLDKLTILADAAKYLSLIHIFCRGLFLRKKGVFSFLMLISTFLP